MVYIVQFMSKQIIIRYGDRGAQGFYEAPSLDVMLLKQQVFSASGANQNREPTFQYAYRAVTFTRSTPGCGTLAGPSLESAGFRSQKPKGYAASPGLNQPGALQKPGRPGSVLLTRYDKHIPGIYLSYVPTQ